MWLAVAKKGVRLSFAQLIAGLLLLVLTSLSGCVSVAPEVKVGLVAPFEGRQREIGYDVLYSARLAVREINAAGGINGTRVALVAVDDGGNPEFAAETAAAMVADPAVVAVVGHWTPETTAAAQPRYDDGGLALLPGGEPPFAAADPGLLSPTFVADYTAVTPFDEVPGPYAGASYEAFQTLWQAMAEAQRGNGVIDRAGVVAALAAGAGS